jgi:hypothetical protein
MRGGRRRIDAIGSARAGGRGRFLSNERDGLGAEPGTADDDAGSRGSRLARATAMLDA